MESFVLLHRFGAMAVVSGKLKQFLAQRLSSPEHIAVVLLLHREPDRSWTATEVAAALGIAAIAIRASTRKPMQWSASSPKSPLHILRP